MELQFQKEGKGRNHIFLHAACLNLRLAKTQTLALLNGRILHVENEC